MDLNRRRFVSTLAATSLGAALPLRFAWSKTPQDRRFVFIILRGGMDGLAAFPAFGDEAYGSARNGLGLPAPDETDGIIDLNGFFGMHPAMEALLPLYQKGDMAVLHAIASPYRSRSHFDGQDLLEQGGTKVGEMREGWLNRAMAELGGTQALAISPHLPLVLQGGAENISSWYTKRFQADTEGDFMHTLQALYTHDATLHPYLQKALEAEKTASMVMSAEDKKSGRKATQISHFPALVKTACAFLKDTQGPRVAVLETAGWDTHANQGLITGQLPTKLAHLAEGLAAFPETLGKKAWEKTVVVVATEFGRTVAANGTKGTDHGTASVALMLGGNIQGGQVVSHWPGLAKHQLYDGRDLKPALDMRSLFKTVLHHHLQISQYSVERRIFPDSASATLFSDLL